MLAVKPIFECLILGRPIVKKNTQRVIGSGKRKRVIYSKKFLQWQSIANSTIQRGAGVALLINEPIEAHFKFYFKNRSAEADVSNLVEGPQDVLKKTGIIADDKLIMRVRAEKFFGSEPRTEIKLYKFLEEIV